MNFSLVIMQVYRTPTWQSHWTIPNLALTGEMIPAKVVLLEKNESVTIRLQNLSQARNTETPTTKPQTPTAN